jgi:RES domain-containing protein
MILVWRIGTDTRTYQADDMTGTGAKITGGRWNSAGNALIYAASSRALACLETVVHLGGGGLPLNRYLVQLDVPDDVWKARTVLDLSAAPVGWDALPEGMVSLSYGDSWLASHATAILLVPSIVVPEEQNILINPAHPDAAFIKATKVRKWLYDSRLKPSPS